MFFASIAHELRTPLNTIIPMTKKLQQLEKDPGLLKYIKIIKNSSIFLENLIEDALDMSRIENNKFQINESLIDIREALSDVTSIIQLQVDQKGIQLETLIS